MEQKEIQQEQQRWLKVTATKEFGHRQDVGPDKDLLWHEGQYQVEDEEEEPAQERKAGRRSRKRRGRGKLQQQQQQQEEIGEDGWEVYIMNIVVELCPSCGHTLAICPMQYDEGERERPEPRRGGAHASSAQKGGSPCVQRPEGENLRSHSPRGGRPTGPEPRPPAAEEEYLLPLPLPPPPAEGEYLLVPSLPLWENSLPLPPSPAESECLLVPPQLLWEDCLPLPAPPAAGEYLLVPSQAPWK
ncbi:UNVERIFIED_CONTAM: hypothetical protein FKN15_047978 [Acipenser sinensis]